MFKQLKRWWRGFPSNNFLDEATREVHQTPDLHKLEKRRYNLFFEYGELMDGLTMFNPQLLPRTPLWSAYTAENFSLWKKNETVIPKAIALKMNFENPGTAQMAIKAKIRGELYLVTTQDIIELDKYHHAGVQFDRRRVNMFLPVVDFDGMPKRVNAWMYIGKTEYWKSPLEWNEIYFPSFRDADFSLVKLYDDTRRPWINRYYHYTPYEFKRENDLFKIAEAGALSRMR